MVNDPVREERCRVRQEIVLEVLGASARGRERCKRDGSRRDAIRRRARERWHKGGWDGDASCPCESEHPDEWSEGRRRGRARDWAARG